jgi:general secretion pathway protein I
VTASVSRDLTPTASGSRGFTLVEVLVALIIVAMGLGALMVAVSGTARTSGYLRDKTLAEWIALNHLSEIRLNLNQTPLVNSTLTNSTPDSVQLNFAGRKWHYDTRYFDTTFTSMKRVVVRVYAGDKNTKGNPLAEATGFLSTSLATPGSSNVPWNQGSTLATANGAAANATGTGITTATPAPTTGAGTTPVVAPAPTPQAAPQQ